jgi:hypothetical protein
VAIGTARLLFREEAESEDPAGKVIQHPSAPRAARATPITARFTPPAASAARRWSQPAPRRLRVLRLRGDSARPLATRAGRRRSRRRSGAAEATGAPPDPGPDLAPDPTRPGPAGEPPARLEPEPRPPVESSHAGPPQRAPRVGERTRVPSSGCCPLLLRPAVCGPRPPAVPPPGLRAV